LLVGRRRRDAAIEVAVLLGVDRAAQRVEIADTWQANLDASITTEELY
jgi:hypothetical protein